MKRIMALVLAFLMFGLVGCGEQTEEKDVLAGVTAACGHRTLDGHEYSYDWVVTMLYGRSNIAWEEYDYADLKFVACQKLVDLEIELVALTSEYEYAACRINTVGGEEKLLVFAYDMAEERVVACFEDIDSEYDRYLHTWEDAYELVFCLTQCECGKY